MKKLITTMTVALILALSTPAFAQDFDAGAEAPAVVETAPAETAPQPEAVEKVESATEEPAEEAPAPEAADSMSPALSKLMTHVFELLGTLMMLLMTALIAKASAYFTKKTKIEIPAKTEEMIAEWGRKGVNYANEKAHQYAKEKGEAMPIPDKVEHALSFGISLAEEYGLPNLAKEKLVKYTESHLGEVRVATAE